MLTPAQRMELEILIDKDDLSSVLSEVAGICQEKAEHIMESYGDRGLAANWSRASAAVERASNADAVRKVSGSLITSPRRRR